MLGKGLESLIPNKNESEQIPAVPEPRPIPPPRPDPQEAVFHIETDRIAPNPHQPRRHFDESQLAELASSVREFGVIQPIIVSKIERETPYGTAIEYQLIAGERRLMAAKLAGLPRIPAIVRVEPGEREKFEMAVVENIQRADLNPIETARSYAKLQEKFGLTQREVAMRMGKSREVVANALRLLNLPTGMQDAIASGKMSESQGRVLLAVADPVRQEQLFLQATTTNASVRDMKAAIARMDPAFVPSLSGDFGEASSPSVVATPVSAPLAVPETDLQFVNFEPEDAYAKLARELQEALHVPVRIDRTSGRNTVAIDCPSEDGLRALVEKIRRNTS